MYSPLTNTFLGKKDSHAFIEGWSSHLREFLSNLNNYTTTNFCYKSNQPPTIGGLKPKAAPDRRHDTNKKREMFLLGAMQQHS